MILLGASAWPQSSTPLGALEEMATAEKPQDLLRHLPASLETLVNGLPEPERAARLKRLSFSKGLQYFGMALSRSEDGSGWEITSGGNKGIVQPRNAFISGVDAMVPIEVSYDDPPRKDVYVVSMRFEQGEWRVAEVERWSGTDLESEIARKLDPAQENETEALNFLRTLMQSLFLYAERYPGTGLPGNLKNLAGKEEDQPSPEHARILDESFVQEHIVRNGYEFRYTVIDSGGENLWRDGKYRITAVPVEFGRTGVRSFFIDQTGVIRFTSANQPANEDDQPLNRESLNSSAE